MRDKARLFADFVELPPVKVAGQIFNVGSDTTNLQIQRLAEIVTQSIPGTKLTFAQDDEDLRSYHVSFKKLRDQIGFKAEFGVEDGVHEVERELRANASLDSFAEDFYNVRRMKHLLEVPPDQGGEPWAPRFIPLAKPEIGRAHV